MHKDHSVGHCIPVRATREWIHVTRDNFGSGDSLPLGFGISLVFLKFSEFYFSHKFRFGREASRLCRGQAWFYRNLNILRNSPSEVENQFQVTK